MITIEQVISWGPCCRKPGERYDDAHLAALFAGRPSLTWPEVAALDISREDVVWLATRPGTMPPETHVRLANRWADRAVKAAALHCGVPAVETWAARWLSGEDRSVRSAADAARAARAARAAADAWPAWAAAWAARAAAEEAWAARAAERALQVADILAEVQR